MNIQIKIEHSQINQTEIKPFTKISKMGKGDLLDETLVRSLGKDTKVALEKNCHDELSRLGLIF